MTDPTPAIRGTRDDLLWLAGLLEGEGTFDLHRGKYPRIRLGMTDRDVVGRAASLMGASIRLALHKFPDKPMWHTEISGARAEAILAELITHMGARRSARIAEILSGAKFRRVDASQAPGPKVSRPAGIAPVAVA